MTRSLIGQRSRGEVIAELYERHAAGLFAYCHDQLGETSSAADAVAAVFGVTGTSEPPEPAVLYALARREIYRRDVSYALPSVDAVADPATALIERVFRDIRPHQREVLLLSARCGLTTPELAVVLDVALDTAEELALAARRRFTVTLDTAVTAARSAPFVAPEVAEVYDAIGVSPIGDVLARLPWRRPPAAVRDRVLSALPQEEPGTPPGPGSGTPTTPPWPTTPIWPLPASSPPAPAASRSERRHRARHEATTEPMPRLRGSVPKAIAPPLTAPIPTTGKTSTGKTTTGAPQETAQDTVRNTIPDTVRDAPAPPRTAAREGHRAPRRAAKPAKSAKPAKPAKIDAALPMGHDQHHDWLWEVVGFLICLAVALAVFSLTGTA